MIKYVIKRLVMMIPILLAVTILIFTLMYFVPGDPVQIQLATASKETIEAMREQLGYNRGYFVRLAEYCENLFFHFDFGRSYTSGISVGQELLRRFPATFKIAALSILFSVMIGIPVGIRSAVKANQMEDRISMFLTLIGNSMPNFWLALILVLVFSVRLNWFPSSGDGGIEYYILPSLANSIGGIASIARQTRASMLEVIRSDYVTTARAKGHSEFRVIYGEALPNALIPIITVCGSRFGHMLGGTMIIETVFSIPGIGSYLVDAINVRDYNVVQGSVIYIAFTFSIMMLVIDIIYAYVDPRIKARYVKK